MNAESPGGFAATGRDEQDVLQRLNEVADPCSVTAAVPIGLSDMGLVAGLELTDREIHVAIEPTFPGCMYLDYFTQEITRVLADDPRTVHVTLSSLPPTWDESRIAPRARERLSAARREASRRTPAGAARALATSTHDESLDR